jgi:hypothetical protein
MDLVKQQKEIDALKKAITKLELPISITPFEFIYFFKS